MDLLIFLALLFVYVWSLVGVYRSAAQRGMNGMLAVILTSLLLWPLSLLGRRLFMQRR